MSEADQHQEFQLYLKNRLKDIQDKATQADNSYTSDEAERDFEDAYLKTYMKDVQLSVKISQPFTKVFNP